MGIPISKQTSNDLYWLRAFSPAILWITYMLEIEAYDYVKEQGRWHPPGVGVHKLSDNVDGPEMQGALMRSPLSQRTCNFDLETLRSYVDDRCESLDGTGCREFIKILRGMRVAPILLPMFMSESKQSKSYDWLQEYLQRPDCEWIFCRQLSDQLVICEECGERPILYNVLKDEDTMQRHLDHHHAESDARAVLMNNLVAEVKASCLLESATGASPGK